MILILTWPGDLTADAVVARLHARGAQVLRVDPADFPRRVRARARVPVAGSPSFVLEIDGEPFDLGQVRVGWDRRPGRPQAGPEVTDPLARRFCAREGGHFLDDLWHALGCSWVPGPAPVVQRGQHKLTQLLLARDEGFTTPETLFGNDSDAVIEMWGRHRGDLISKTFWSALLLTAEDELTGRGWRRYTERVGSRQLQAIGSLRHAPAIFQPRVEKALEVRATVFGDAVLAAGLHSQRQRRTRVDWRRFDADHLRHDAHALPADVARRCASLTRRMGLCFSTIDLILKPDGTYVFLELNPSGQWRWIEAAAGLPLTEAMCDLLLELARAAAPPPACSTVPSAG